MQGKYKKSHLKDFEYLAMIGWLVKPSGCWEYRGARNKQGYGIARKQKAHRVAYKHWYGEIPPGKVIRHRCDNPPCVNPRHLVPGTQAQNVQDMVHRGRYRNGKKYRGGEHPRATLTQEQAEEIRTDYLTGLVTYEMLGQLYGVGTHVVSQLIRGETYSH